MSRPKIDRRGKIFVGAYIDKQTRTSVAELAKADCRPLTYMIQKLLYEALAHRAEANGIKEAA